MDTNVRKCEADLDKVDISVWDLIKSKTAATWSPFPLLPGANLYLNQYYKSNKRHKVVWCIIHLLWTHVKTQIIETGLFMWSLNPGVISTDF